MNVVENGVRSLVDKELEAANERFPKFHSAHEGYAVILEEVAELREQTDYAETALESVWFEVRDNHSHNAYIERLSKHAINAACEAIQVAAMCQKFLEMEGNQ